MRSRSKATYTEGHQLDEATMVQYVEYARVSRRLAQRSLQLLAVELARLLALCKATPIVPLEVQPHHIRRWLAALHSRGASARTLALTLSIWRGYYRWLTLDSRIEANPAADIKAPKVARLLPKALSVDIAQQLADAPPAQDPRPEPAWLTARDQLIVELLYGCGLRVSELVGLDTVASPQALAQQRGWVEETHAQLHVLGKGGKRRSVPLGKAAQAALAHYLPLREQHISAAGVCSPALLLASRATRISRISRQGVWAVLKRRSAQAGLPIAVHPHMLRHSFASHVLQSSGDLRAVQELLGHSSIASTQIYTKLDFQHLAKIYDSAHPRAIARQNKPQDD